MPVIGVALADAAHAYPVHLMEHHQIVNGRLGEKPVVVAYDPLTGIPLAYQRTVKGRVLTFGVSGLLYRGQFLLYDRETESLWAHYEGRAVSGPLAGTRLTRLQTRQEPMGAWFKRHPQTQVLARPERMRIDYRYSPYQAYWISEDVPWKLSVRDDRYHPKELVLGVRVKGKTRAYLGSILTSEGGRIVDEIAGVKIRIVYDSDTGTFVWEAPPDVELTDAYWFAWKSFHPDTEIWHDNRPAIEPRSSNENPPLRGSGGTTAARRAA